MSTLVVLTCEVDGKSFLRAPTGAPALYCSKACRNRAYYLKTNGVSRQRRSVGRVAPQKQRRQRSRTAYDREYNRRPHVKERARARAASIYEPHPRVRRLQRVNDIEVPAPYVGHPGLEMARAAVGSDFAWDKGEVSDRRQDEMGEALLALLEGRDPKEAVREFRRREYVPRHLTQHIGDWSGDDSDQAAIFERVMPTAPSAEDEVIARETVLHRTPYHGGHGKGMMGRSRQQQPSRRRQRDAGWRRMVA